MKYRVTIWTADGISRQAEVNKEWADRFLSENSQPPRETDIYFTDTSGVDWFFNWNHVLGGRVQEIKE